MNSAHSLTNQNQQNFRISNDINMKFGPVTTFENRTTRALKK